MNFNLDYANLTPKPKLTGKKHLAFTKKKGATGKMSRSLMNLHSRTLLCVSLMSKGFQGKDIIKNMSYQL